MTYFSRSCANFSEKTQQLYVTPLAIHEIPGIVSREGFFKNSCMQYFFFFSLSTIMNCITIPLWRF